MHMYAAKAAHRKPPQIHQILRRPEKYLTMPFILLESERSISFMLPDLSFLHKITRLRSFSGARKTVKPRKIPVRKP